MQGQISVAASKALAAEALSDRYLDLRALLKLLTKLTQVGKRGRLGGCACAYACVAASHHLRAAQPTLQPSGHAAGTWSGAAQTNCKMYVPPKAASLPATTAPLQADWANQAPVKSGTAGAAAGVDGEAVDVAQVQGVEGGEGGGC